MFCSAHNVSDIFIVAETALVFRLYISSGATLLLRYWPKCTVILLKLCIEVTTHCKLLCISLFIVILFNTLKKERFCFDDKPRGDYGIQIKIDDDHTLEQVMQKDVLLVCILVTAIWDIWVTDKRTTSYFQRCVSKSKWG